MFFTQDHKPGEELAVDWTDMGGLGIMIEGKALAHKLFHAVLPYSNWEWAVRAHSESTLSLRGGLKATLGRLGRVPRQLRTTPDPCPSQPEDHYNPTKTPKYAPV